MQTDYQYLLILDYDCLIWKRVIWKLFLKIIRNHSVVSNGCIQFILAIPESYNIHFQLLTSQGSFFCFTYLS